MASSGKFRLRKQWAGGASFAVVGLCVEESGEPGQGIEVSPAEDVWCGRPFLAAIEVGVHYARRKLSAEGHPIPSLAVSVTEFQYRTVDTTLMGVVFASTMAFCDAMGMELKRPPAYTEGGLDLVFPQSNGDV